jgi:hypothetical protein
MRLRIICTLSLLLMTLLNYAQSNNNGSSKKVLTSFDKVMTDLGFPYTKNSDSTASIFFNGPEVIKSYSVEVFKVSGVYVAFVDISTNMGIKVDPSKYKYLLRANNSIDLVKFGIEEDGAVTVRYETYENGFNIVNFKRVINQLAAATEEIAPQLK